ncbi:hypothetical protein FHS61_000516 [Altererythrobacter atlanticus]|uniref:Uncharacterized protein n=2 Tax=Erythrobacteraceae TaxID=335929 RepID=A0A0F7KQE7_9SPHN|nr:hypothetical protein WYH_01707 [Croceibacterium atlanticum]MBB5731523.1 hypothetical protein [Croceibacterium atlanticum]MDQ0567325.1 hypothetical protein [Qipengyuania citrea]
MLWRRLGSFCRGAIGFHRTSTRGVSLKGFALSRSQHLPRQIDGSLHLLDVSSSCSQTGCSYMRRFTCA